MLHDIIYTVADYSKSALKSSCTVGMMCWSDTGQSSRETDYNWPSCVDQQLMSRVFE